MPRGMTLAALLLVTSSALAADWPAWRGPGGDGVTPERDLPVAWSASENVAWKVPLPGPGNSTPVVSGGRVFVTGATEKGAVRSVMCFGRDDGRLLWKGDTRFAGQEPTHETNVYCSASPVTDGKRVFAWHGSAGVVAYDFDGKPLWRRDLGSFRHIWGNAASPVLHDGKLILSCGPGPVCFLIALNPDTGETLWKTDLLEAAGKDAEEWKGSWCTPVVRKVGGADAEGADEIVLALPGYVAGFDPATGKETWRCAGLGKLVYANPLVGEGVIVAMSGYQGPDLALRAPEAGETGDLTATHRLWLHDRTPQRVGSGVMAAGRLYILNEPGVAQCIDPRTGKDVYKQRASGSNWGSMVLAGDKIYVTDQSGMTAVLAAAPEFKVLHENDLNETTRASVAPSDGQLFIRTYKHLYCIGRPAQ